MCSVKFKLKTNVSEEYWLCNIFRNIEITDYIHPENKVYYASLFHTRGISFAPMHSEQNQHRAKDCL